MQDKIYLYDGKEVLIDEDDYSRVMEHTWYHIHSGYAYTKIRNKTVLLHRFIVNAPKGKEVDHINGNTLDNRKLNLRICTRSQNSFNQPKRKNSKYSMYKGVTWFTRDKKWKSQIMLSGRQINIGLFENERHAALAYDLWAKELFGKYARLNFNLLT